MSGPPGVIVCPVEAPDRSLPGISAAHWLSRELRVRLHLVHAFDPMGVPVPPMAELARADRSTEDLVRAARTWAEVRLGEAAWLVDDVDPVVTLLEGPVVPTLLRHAREHAASLLVTATAAPDPVDRLLAGSVSHELAAGAPCARLAAALGRGLILAHVRRAAEEGDQDVRAAVAALAAAEAVDGVEAAFAEGEAVEHLSHLARVHDVGLVVAGTRGRGAAAAAVLGSVSAALLRSTARAVLLVPATAGD